MNEAQNLSYQISCESPTSCIAKIVVASSVVEHVYRQAVISQKKTVDAPGFAKGTAPYEYISQILRPTLLDHVQEFLLNYCVLNELYAALRTEKIVMAGMPRLTAVDLDHTGPGTYTFEITRIADMSSIDWHYLPFKAPRRKNYKDLDRQVESFIKEEKDRLKITQGNDIAVGDWVSFDVSLAHSDPQNYHEMPRESFWIKVGEEDVDEPFRNLLIGKKAGETFISDSSALQEYFSSQLTTNYQFHLTIQDTIKHSFFCLEQFKKHFKIKTNKELEQKLIEVFSYRNDISLRRSMAEESLKLITQKHRFEVPHHLLLRQQELLLDQVQHNPDYHVYRVQKDFGLRIRQLAEKQVKEIILIDHLAYHEHISITDQEVKGYLNLLQRPRTKEFIYFHPPVTKRNGQEIPIAANIIKQTCLREKTLNHVIHHLTRQ